MESEQTLVALHLDPLAPAVLEGLVILAVGLVLGLALELISSARVQHHSLATRWANNLSLSLISYYFRWLLSSIFLVVVAGYIERNSGQALIPLSELPLPLAVLCLFLVLEAVDYWTHRLMHRLPALWRVHMVHHSDPDVDVSTSVRHHPFEAFVTMPPVVLLLWLMGPPLEALLIFQVLRVLLTTFTHCNIRLPGICERILVTVLVTPTFHRVHHCADLPYTDSNFGSVVPWFDYLFGTARVAHPQGEDYPLGLAEASAPDTQRLDQLLWWPFRASRRGA